MVAADAGAPAVLVAASAADDVRRFFLPFDAKIDATLMRERIRSRAYDYVKKRETAAGTAHKDALESARTYSANVLKVWDFDGGRGPNLCVPLD